MVFWYNADIIIKKMNKKKLIIITFFLGFLLQFVVSGVQSGPSIDYSFESSKCVKIKEDSKNYDPNHCFMDLCCKDHHEFGLPKYYSTNEGYNSSPGFKPLPFVINILIWHGLSFVLAWKLFKIKNSKSLVINNKNQKVHIFLKELFLLSLIPYLFSYLFFHLVLLYIAPLLNKIWPNIFIVGYRMELIWLIPLMSITTILFYHSVAVNIRKKIADPDLSIYRSYLYTIIIAILVYSLMKGSPWL